MSDLLTAQNNNINKSNNKKKIVMFNDNSDSSDQDEQINLQTLVKANSLQLQSKFLQEPSTPKPFSFKSKDNSPLNSNISNQNPYQLPLASQINNTLISIQLSVQNSYLSSQNSDLFIMKLKRNILDQDIQLFIQFAQKNDFEFTNTYNKCFVFKKKPSGTFRLFNCLIFKSQPDFSIKIQILQISNEIRISLNSGRQQQFIYYQGQLKRLMWAKDIIKFDEVQSINYILDSQSERLCALIRQHKLAEKLQLTPSLLETAMRATVNLREQIIKTARKKDEFYKIKIQQFIDRKLFNNLNLFCLYKKAYTPCQQNYQVCRNKIIQVWNRQKQFQYLQIPIQHQLINSPLPYKLAIDELMRLNLVMSPAEKLNVIRDTYRLIKNSIPLANNRPVQVQQLFPILIYILLNSKVNYIYANICMTDHFLQQIQSSQKSLVTNMYVAVEYIVNSWQK